jgi:deoxyribodipyrimidine photolyase
MRYLKITSLLSIVLLAGCLSPQQRAELNQEFRQRYVNELSSRCSQYGFRYGTNEFAQCMQRAEAQDTNAYQVQTQQRNQAMQNMNEALKPPTFLPPPCNGGMMPTTGQVNCK